MKRTAWIERTFYFDFPEGLLPNIIERLAGTEVRMLKIVDGLSEADCAIKYDNKWSIKEQIGHLYDLEDLHINRIDEMIEHKPELSAADMSNQKTEQSNHNELLISELIALFAEKRTTLIKKLLSLDDKTQQFKAKHPRLGITMRPIDVAFFTAEHDDHHLASIRENLHLLGG